MNCLWSRGNTLMFSDYFCPGAWNIFTTCDLLRKCFSTVLTLSRPKCRSWYQYCLPVQWILTNGLPWSPHVSGVVCLHLPWVVFICWGGYTEMSVYLICLVLSVFTSYMLCSSVEEDVYRFPDMSLVVCLHLSWAVFYSANSHKESLWCVWCWLSTPLLHIDIQSHKCFLQAI